MLKSKVESRKKENGQTPVKESSSPKNVNVKRNFQAEAVSQSPATSRRDSRRSQSSDSATIRSKDAKVESPRAVSADRVREQSKSPARGPRNSLSKQKQGTAVEVNSPVISNKSARSSSAHEMTAQDSVQSPKRRSGKQVPELPASLEKRSPRRSRGAEKNQAVSPVPSPAGSSRRASKGQSIPPITGIENQEISLLPVQSPKGRRSGSKEQTKGTPTKSAGGEAKVNEQAQGLSTRKSPKKRRSADLGLVEPPLKRKRVSFGGHLSPELFDKRLPPNSPLKKGATPARRSLSLNSPRAVIRKSFGLKQTSIKEVFEFSGVQSVSSPLAKSTTSPRRASSSGASQMTYSGGSPGNNLVSSPNRRSSAVNKKSPSKSPLSVTTTPKKQSPNRRSPSKIISFSSPSTRSPAISPSKTPIKKTPVKPEPTSSAKKSPLLNLPGSSKKSPVKSLPSTPVGKSVSPSTTPAKRSPSTRSPIPVKKSPIKSEATTPSKLSTPGKRSPGRPLSATPSKKSPGKLSTPGKRSPGKSPSTSPARKSAKLSTPGKKLPVRPPSPSPARSSAKLSTPGKKSPGRSPSKTPAKKSPAKLSTPGKKSPGRSPSNSSAKKSPGRSPAKKSPAKLSTPVKKSPGKSPSKSPVKSSAKLSTPAKRSPGRPPSTTPAKKSPAKLSTPVKRSPGKSPATKSPVAKSPRTPASVKATKSPVSTRKSVSRSPSTPYTKGRFSISRVATPPQIAVASQTPKQPRKSLTSKKTPHRRSRKLDAFEVIRARRRSGASEANLFVAKSWADVVKIGVAKAQKKSVDKPIQKAVATKKKPKPKTPARRVKDLSSTGHADSPATILVGRAHTRTLDLAGYVPKVVRNQAVKLNPPHNESFTGMAELFSTPESSKQRRSSRFDGSKEGTPKSTVEVSVMQTPEEAGEMVVSPLNSPATTQRKRFGRDAVSRLLEVPVSPELSKVAVAEKAEQEASRSRKDSRKSVGLTGVKRIMKTPKQKGKPVTDPHALRKLLKTPKETKTTQAHTRRSVNLEPLGIAQLMKTPKQKGQPVEDLTGVKRILKTPKQRVEPVENHMGISRIMKTPRQKVEPVEDYSGVRRIMRTPKERGEAVEDMVGIKRIMRSPKVRGQPVEDMVGIKRLMRSPKVRGQPVEDMLGIQQLMRTPKVRGQPVEDIDISHLMSTPAESTQSTENTRPIEEIFGIKNLVKTPPKRPAMEQALAADLRNATEALRPLSSSNTPAKRGRHSKRLSLPAETATTVNEVQKTMQVAEIEIAQESGVHSIEIIKSAQKKKGRQSKNVPLLSASEAPKDSPGVPEVTSPSQRGRPRTTPEVPKEPQVSEKVTSPSRRGRPRSTVLSPVANKTTSQANEESISQVQAESVSTKVLTPSRRGRTSSTLATPKESVVEVTSPSRRGRASTTMPKETPASAEVVTSPTRGGKLSTTLKAAEESQPLSQEITSPTRKGRPSNTVANDLVSPTRKGRPSRTSEVIKEPVSDSSEKITSPKTRGRPSAGTHDVPVSNENLTSPSRKGRSSLTTGNEKDSLQDASAKIVSPTRRGRQSITAQAAKESNKTNDSTMASPSREKPKESLSASEAKIVSPSRRGRSVKAAKESVPVANEIASPSRRARSVEAAKESVPVAIEIASPKRRGRQALKEVVAKDLDTSTDGKVKNTRERSEVSKEPASVPAATLQTRRGRSKDPEVVPKDTVPVKSAVTSPARRQTSKSTVEVPKQSSVKDTPKTPEEHSKSTVDAPEEPASEVTSPRRGRPKASVTLAKEPVVVTEEASTTRRGRSKISADTTEKSADVSQTRRGRTTAKADQPEKPVPASSADLPSTRRGRTKAAAVVKEPVPEESVSVTSPARRGRPKTTQSPQKPVVATSDVTSPSRKGQSLPSEQPVPAASDVSSPTRRGRPKPTDIPKEPVPIESDISPPTRRGRSKTVEVPKVPIPAANHASLPTRRGRAKTTDVVSVSDSEATSPARSDRLQNKESSVEAASSKARGRSARSTEKTAVSSSELPADANVTNKRGARRRPANQSKQNIEEQQLEAEVSPPVDSNTTTVQPAVPSQRGRGRKAMQNEQPTASNDIVAPTPEKPKLEPRRRRLSKSKNVEETAKETVDPDQANSPAAKSAPVEELTNRVRGRPSRNAQTDSTSEVASPKRTPTKGRSRTRHTSEVSVEVQEEPESKSSASVSKRGQRKNQSANEPQVQSQPTETSRARRGKRGLPDSEQPQPAPEIKGKRSARSKDSGEQSVEDRHTKSKSVQWHPLLTTDVNATKTDQVKETTIEASTRGSRSKGRTKPDVSEATPAKRSRREPSGDKSEPPAVPEANTNSVADVSVKGRRGRKAAVPQVHLEDKSSDAHSSSDDTAKSPAKSAVKQSRGRKAAASNTLDSDSIEVAKVSTSRGRRGAVASIAPAESTSQSPGKSKQKKESYSEAESVATKPTRGGRRKNAATETTTSEATVNEADVVNVPTVRGKRTGRSTKAEKTHTEESLVEQIVSSPAKRRKVEAAPSGKSTKKAAAKPDKVKSPVATRGRASTRSRK